MTNNFTKTITKLSSNIRGGNPNGSSKGIITHGATTGGDSNGAIYLVSAGQADRINIDNSSFYYNWIFLSFYYIHPIPFWYWMYI